MRNQCLVGFAVIILIGILIIIIKTKKKSVVFISLFIGCLIFIGGSKIIYLNTLPKEISDKVQNVIDTVGSSYIKTEGNKVYVDINGIWYDISKVSIIEDIVTKDIVIDYEGKGIYVGHSGVVNTLKVLKQVGLIN